MDFFYNTYKRLLSERSYHIPRSLMREIDLISPLQCIRGARGVGKTSFLLDCGEKYGQDHPERSALYVSLNHFYFTVHKLYDFIIDFHRNGGRLLLLDQIFKYPNWQIEVAQAIRECKELRIIFSTTSVDSPDTHEALKDLVKVYDLRGFSFREYYNLETHQQIPMMKLEDILHNHRELSSIITNTVHPGEFFHKYITDYSLMTAGSEEQLIRHLNMMLEVDVIYIHQIDSSYLPKFRKLLYLLLSQERISPNVSMLSKEIGTSRATVMNYLKYLHDAGLITMLYKCDETYPKKPSQILMNNVSHAVITYPDRPRPIDLYKSFVVSHVEVSHKVNAPTKNNIDLIIDKDIHIKISEAIVRKPSDNLWYIVPNLSIGYDRCIPIWLWGFLY